MKKISKEQFIALNNKKNTFKSKLGKLKVGQGYQFTKNDRHMTSVYWIARGLGMKFMTRKLHSGWALLRVK